MPSINNCSDFVVKGKKIVGVHRNYLTTKDKKELKKTNKLAHEPMFFLKPVSTYLKPGNPILLPQNLSVIVPEVHLGVLINQKIKNIAFESVESCIGGYCLALDLTAKCHLNTLRDEGKPWLITKAFDTSTPVSEMIPVERLGVADNVDLWMTVNGEKRSSGNTKNLLYNITELICYLSKFMTLSPNDLILTGTPCVAGKIVEGDVVECGLGKCVKMKFEVRKAPL